MCPYVSKACVWASFSCSSTTSRSVVISFPQYTSVAHPQAPVVSLSLLWSSLPPRFNRLWAPRSKLRHLQLHPAIFAFHSALNSFLPSWVIYHSILLVLSSLLSLHFCLISSHSLSSTPARPLNTAFSLWNTKLRHSPQPSLPRSLALLLPP